jgi:hypothetical protein
MKPIGETLTYKELKPWVRYLTFQFKTEYLPTQFTVEEPKLVIPQVKRIYLTDLYLKDNTILSYASLCKEPDFKGTLHYKQVYLEEVWEDFGCDGYVSYRLVGWKFTAQ